MLTKLKNKIINLLRRIFILRLIVIKYRVIKGKFKSPSKNKIIRREIKKYEKFYGRTPNLENPSLFSEKIMWQKLYYYDHKLINLADKLLVKEYAKEKLGKDISPKTLRVFKNHHELDFSDLPEVFIIKANHVTGYIYKAEKKGDSYVFRDAKNSSGPSYSERLIKKIFKNILKLNLYKETYEWVYEDIAPRIFIEEFIDMKNMKEYKLQMADGNLGFIDQLWGRLDKTYDNYYDSNLNYMDDVSWDNPSNNTISLPSEIDKIITYAQILSKGIPLARVDFYLIEGVILLGEITFFYSAGYLNMYTPKNLDAIIGKQLDISGYLEETS